MYSYQYLIFLFFQSGRQEYIGAECNRFQWILKMQATKSLHYLRLIFIWFIDILIYLKVLKNALSSMKLNTKIQKKREQRKPTSNMGSQMILFYEIQT